MIKPAQILFYVDADPGGLQRNGRIRAPCPIPDPGAPDEEWIPTTASEGWLIITRDRHIQDRRAEIATVRDSAARTR